MVIKTEICAYSEFRMYPGRGIKYVAKDGKSHIFLNQKAKELFLRKIKAQQITWTVAWRRLHKKTKVDDQGKKKKKRTCRQQRAIIGISVDEIRKKRAEKPEVKKAQAEQAIREIKERKQKVLDQKKNEKKSAIPKDKAAKREEKKAQTKQEAKKAKQPKKK